MSDLLDKAWVVAVIDIKFSGQEIDTQDENKVVLEFVNTHIVDCLEFYEKSKKFDKALFNRFKEDFDGWTVNIFKVANKNIHREFKDRLKNSGVCVGGRGQASDQLFHLLKCDQCPEWPADELELHPQKGTEFKSRRYNPDFDGQQEFIWRNRCQEMSQPTSVSKLESSFEKSAALESEFSLARSQFQPINPQAQTSPSPLTNSNTQVPAKIIVAKVLMDLGKLYGDPKNKFGGGFYDVLDSKLRIFYDMCDKVGVPLDMYSVAYSSMLKDKAQDFYYQHLARQNFSFEVMVKKTRSYFHTPENYQAYLMKWRSTMLKGMIEANPEKNMSECLELVIVKLQKVHQGLVHNYNNNHSLPGQLISACQAVEACSIVLVRPASLLKALLLIFEAPLACV
ncbi:hypothetical protein K3495_g10924 [Podosphaera aphanis]|nr:hypothetical protein K3495_g10924 [Podosphaera aphanis]